MTYVMSDVHGFYDRYSAFLRGVSFCGADRLYIVGDLLNRGSDGIRLLQDVMGRKNVTAILGNHEYMLLPTLQELSCSDPQSQRAVIKSELSTTPIGQEDTLLDFCRQDRTEQLKLLAYIRSLPLYQKIAVCGKKYLLVHGGLPDFSDMDIHYYTREELLFGPHDFCAGHFSGTTTVVGHLPTRFIPGAQPNEIFWANDSIAVDCGLGFGGRLGVLCLETEGALYF